MNNYCINLKKRKKKPFCKLLNKEINLSECYGCDKKEYKTKEVQNSFYKSKNAQNFKKTVHKLKKSTLNRTFTYKKLKKSTYKHKKADSTRFSIITNDLEHCIICGKEKEALHEVFYGAYRHVSIKHGMIIPLCLNHHTQGKFSVHNDRELDLYYKRLAETIFISKYSYELYMKEFTINYLKKD